MKIYIKASRETHKWYVTVMTPQRKFPGFLIEGADFDDAWNKFEAEHPDYEYIDDIDIVASLQDLEHKANDFIRTAKDKSNIQGILKAIKSGTVDSGNIYDYARINWTKRVTSDNQIRWWESVLDWFQIQLQYM